MSQAVIELQAVVVDCLKQAYPKCSVSTDPNSDSDFIVKSDKRYGKVEIEIRTQLFNSLGFGVRDRIQNKTSENTQSIRQVSESSPQLVVVK